MSWMIFYFIFSVLSCLLCHMFGKKCRWGVVALGDRRMRKISHPRNRQRRRRKEAKRRSRHEEIKKNDEGRKKDEEEKRNILSKKRKEKLKVRKRKKRNPTLSRPIHFYFIFQLFLENFFYVRMSDVSSFQVFCSLAYRFFSCFSPSLLLISFFAFPSSLSSYFLLFLIPRT